MKTTVFGIGLLLLVVLSVTAKPVGSQSDFRELKIKEVTVFKDGHAFMLHQGTRPVNQSGEVVLDHLPRPVLGTYWPFSADSSVDLRAVTAGKAKISLEKTALNLREMIEANIGEKVLITERPTSLDARTSSERYEAEIVEIPMRKSEEVSRLTMSQSRDVLPVKGQVVLLKTIEGVKAVAMSQIQDVTFINNRKSKVVDEAFRNRLKMNFNWKGKPPAETEVGMIYLERGIRWIPAYKIEIKENGKVAVKLEATLINELTDLEDVTAHLVIGVPSFAFKDSVDPISLQQDVARLSSHFHSGSDTAFGFYNAIATQQVDGNARGRGGRPSETPINLGPEMEGTQKLEDLFMFTLKHINLRKGERMVMPIAEVELPYEDVYSLDIPFTPPPEVLQNIRGEERTKLYRMFSSPKVMHKIRIHNTGKQPFTTAPALILRDGRLIAQGLMTYASVGAFADVELTTVVDIKVKKTERETTRTPNAVKWNSYNYGRIDLEGFLALTNYKKESVAVEITRYVLGNVDTVGQQGEYVMVNPLEDSSFIPSTSRSNWWVDYAWPSWWYRFNAVGRLNWNTMLEPGQTLEHSYGWHYFWR